MSLTGIKKQVASSFGERLNFLRKQNDISMEELALAVGSTKSAISRYENGLVSPTLDTAQKFADYFMVTVDWIGGGANNESNISLSQSYINVIEKAARNNITPKQLDEIIEFAIKMKGWS